MDSVLRIASLNPSFPATVLSPSSTVSSLPDPRRGPPGYDQISGLSRSSPVSRMASKASKPKSKASSCSATAFTCSRASRAMEAIDLVTLSVLRLQRRKTKDGFIQTHQDYSIFVSSVTLRNLHLPAMPPSRPTTCLPPLSRQSYFPAAVGEEELGFSLLGLSKSGPCGLSLWSIFRGGGPYLSCRSRSVKSLNLTQEFD